MSNGKAIIFSAPSGSGKTTIVKHLLDINPKLGFSISACTRDKRGRNEKNGKDYFFLTPQDFKKKIDEDEFIEWEEVYAGNFYGTLKSEIERIWSEGRHVIFDVDVKGGLNLKKYFGDKALAVFVKVPSLDVLKSRLTDRNTESEDSLSRRVFKARFEMGFEDQFDVTLVNEDLDESLAKAEKLVDTFIGQE
ncbi:MAG: guanylate kinase [Cytophagales bacterium]|nr:guanylate kinase [Cytophagales bacterium]